MHNDRAGLIRRYARALERLTGCDPCKTETQLLEAVERGEFDGPRVREDRITVADVEALAARHYARHELEMDRTPNWAAENEPHRETWREMARADLKVIFRDDQA